MGGGRRAGEPSVRMESVVRPRTLTAVQLELPQLLDCVQSWHMLRQLAANDDVLDRLGQ